MPGRKIFAGARLKAIRDLHRLTQAQLAARLDVSTSYVNQIENNQRPLTAAVMLALAEGFNLDLSELMSDKSDRLLADLREVLADPVFGTGAPSLPELKTVTSSAPSTAHAVLRLYEAYRKSAERLASMDDALAQQPGGAPQTAYEEVRDFFHYAGNYLDPLDRAAEELAQEIGGEPRHRLDRLVAYVEDAHAIKIAFTAPELPDMIRAFDRVARRLSVSDRLEPSTQFFQIAAQLALMEQTTRIGAILDAANFKTADARRICQIGLANYFAGALHMPYGAFLAAAEAERHDLGELAHRFGASTEQIAHRLSTLQRPKARGVPFFFARVDAAGTITKRHSATPLQFARFGGACPLWNVHQAFEAHGRIIRQLAETPDGHRYLCLAWSAEKPGRGFHGPARRYAYALGCEIEFASRLVYADGLAIGRDAAFDPIGVSCRICERRDCAQRSVPPVAAAISVDPDRRAVVPYEIV